MKTFASHIEAGEAWMDRLARWRQRIARQRRAAREMAMLNALSEHTLRDIGLAREPNQRVRRM